MEQKIIQEIRTNNFNDGDVMKKITDMWKDASSKLSNHKGSIYGLYHEYESDYKGDYTLSVSIECANESSIVVPDESKFEVFKVDIDDEQGVLKTWNEIWKKEEEGQLKRAYTYDYEKYYRDGSIDIYIAIKEK